MCGEDAPTILIDADACPVKEEIMKVGFRYAVPMVFVANSGLRLPRHELITMITVSKAFDAADHEIVTRAGSKTIVVTADILLAEECLRSGARVINPNGKTFTVDMIGGAIAARAIMNDLRGAGDQGELAGRPMGAPAFSKADRSRFLQTLDQALVQLKKTHVGS
ncbi:MAG: YaiI/YqxD family protein [Pseudomonadota bacterium]